MPERTETSWPPEMLITPHFALDEFTQPANRGMGFPVDIYYPQEWITDRLRPLCEVLEVIRAELGGVPITILSGYRSRAYNDRLRSGKSGVAQHSQHIDGRAADIAVHNRLPIEVRTTILQLWDRRTGAPLPGTQAPRIGGLGLYDRWVHVDVRPGDRLVTWTG